MQKVQMLVQMLVQKAPTLWVLLVCTWKDKSNKSSGNLSPGVHGPCLRPPVPPPASPGPGGQVSQVTTSSTHLVLATAGGAPHAGAAGGALDVLGSLGHLGVAGEGLLVLPPCQ